MRGISDIDSSLVHGVGPFQLLDLVQWCIVVRVGVFCRLPFSAASRRAAIATTFADSNAAEAVAEAAAAKTAWYNQRRSYRQLQHNKSAEFWRGKLEANQSDPHKLWKIVDDLLGRGREPVSSAIDVEVFNQFLRRKLPKWG